MICEYPEPIEGIGAIFQYELVGDGLTIYLGTTEAFAGL